MTLGCLYPQKHPLEFDVFADGATDTDLGWGNGRGSPTDVMVPTDRFRLEALGSMGW